jgi:ABC-type multidrug transport system fused ATPase/permease subunit
VTPSPTDRVEGIDTGGETLHVFGRALRYVAPFRWRFGWKAVLTLLSVLPSVLLPWPVKIVIDHVVQGIPIGGTPTPYPALVQSLLDPLRDASTLEILLWVVGIQALLIVVIGAFGTQGSEADGAGGSTTDGWDAATRSENQANAGFSFAGGLFGLYDYRYTLRLTQAFNHHYRSRLFERIQSLPMTAFSDERIGDSVYRVMYDTPSITGLAYQLILTPLVAPVSIAIRALVIWLAYESLGLAWAALAALPLVFVVTVPFSRAIRRTAEASRATGATTTSTIEEGVTNVLAVQSLGAQGRERRRFDRDSWRSFGAFRRLVLTVIWVCVAAAVPFTALSLWVFFEVTGQVIDGTYTPGDFALLFTYFFQIASGSIRLGSLWIAIQGSAAGLHRVFHLMDLPSEEDAPGARELPPIREGLRIDDVSYAYPDGTRALDHASLEANVGEVVALVGPAGAGKTTLAWAIPRYVQPDSGRVLADGVDTSQVTLESLRSQVAFVFQEVSLFDMTVADNIRLGKPDASDAEVERAARTARAHDFIAELPQGYQTRLGRGGGKLSVGQKQRISIARALVRDAPVLILDEPTAALDPATERALVASLHDASRDRVVIVIAHRLSSIRGADRIAFLDRGGVIEEGTHEELMARPAGAYRRFVELQVLGAA